MRSFRAVLVVVSLFAVGCSNPSGSDGPPALITALPRALTDSELSVIDASNTFGIKLLARVTSQQPDKNVFLSPVSATMALGMTMNGAAGTTYDEMRATLGFPEALGRAAINGSYKDLIALLRTLDARVDFRIANSIWYRDTFGPSINAAFLSDAQNFFDARGAGLDFDSPSALTTINDWVKQATADKIPTILDEISRSLVMVLINAIYFKGDWRDAFKPSDTRPEAFLVAGAPVQVPTMHRTGKMRASVIDGRTVVDLGYGGDAFSMTVVLPRTGETANDLVQQLAPAFWSSLGTLPTVEVELSMPKFRLTWERELKDDLQPLGMRQAFVPGGADFTGISSAVGRDLFISFVKQKTFVDVNEVGTEAAAVTAVGIGVTSAPQRLTVRVDRPFVFALRERLSGTVLFVGRVLDPRQAE
jgi:serine protease inhibitor